jgi:hypothetical protein
VKQINLFHFVCRLLAGEAAVKERPWFIWGNVLCNHFEFNCLDRSERRQKIGVQK